MFEILMRHASAASLTEAVAVDLDEAMQGVGVSLEEGVLEVAPEPRLTGAHAEDAREAVAHGPPEDGPGEPVADPLPRGKG